MAIKNIEGTNQILKSYGSNDWVKKADIQHEMRFPHEGGGGRVGESKESKSFGEFLTQSLADVNKLQQDANLAMEKLASGKTHNLHETMLAVEKADIAFRTMNQVRNKVIDAYREIMKMQV